MSPVDAPRPEDWELLGVEPGSPREQAAAAYRRRRAVYAHGSLATYMLLEDDERKTVLGRLDEAWARISAATGVSHPRPPAASSREEVPETGPMPDLEHQPGAYLRAQRMLRGISLEAVCAETKIRPAILQLIERDELEGLPAPVYVRGFVVQVARMLGLGEVDAIAESYLRRLSRGGR